MEQPDLFAQPFSRAIAKQQKAVQSATAMHRPVKTHRRRLVRKVADLLREEVGEGKIFVRSHWRVK